MVEVIEQSQAATSNSSIKSGLLVFRIIKGRDKLVNFRVLNQADQYIGPSQLNMQKDDDGWSATVGFTGTEKSIELIYAPTQEVVSYPFELQLAQPQ